ncbi:hypothetical protein [Methylocapsa palsarum]|uniref:Uncharacterized protein n=1 Tax=Methylocapsa palsarum TaxID=1612308 RepID=A0A1I3Y9V7_9HYPH|nr:hypothetical protein [Methylocapsa palsarum]SFK28638.1 hypothetical protein SAMN05444581_105118 [Methylocapsa palsarum]
MSTTLQKHRNPEAVSRDKIINAREFIHEESGWIGIQAELAQTYSWMGDDAGLEYALRSLIGRVNAVRMTFKELVAEKEKLAAAKKPGVVE